jgi:hypothetical protein
MQYDIVITTYHTVSSIWRKHSGQPGNEKSIFSLIWHRVVLDEGREFHIIYSSTANLNSSYYPEPPKSNSSSMLRSPFDETMGDHWDSNSEQALRFR